MKATVSILLTLYTLSAVYGYNILVIIGTPSHSHFILGKGIVDALLSAGHQVTWVTPFPFKHDIRNLKLIPVDTLSLAKKIDINMMDKQNYNHINFGKEFSRNITTICINTPEVKEVLTKIQFDAVVTELFFSHIEAGYAAVQQAPWILSCASVHNPEVEELMDVLRSVSMVPLFNDYPTQKNFWQRTVNVGMYLMMAVTNWFDFSENSAAYDSLFGPMAAAREVRLPPFSEALHNISLLLVNSHPSFAPAIPLPLNVIQIAGYHIPEDTPPLPKHLQDLLDSSTKGFVYFSMGSLLKSSELPDHTCQDIIDMLGQIPYTVLWKYEKELTGLPKNVHVRPWMPQASILAHPNIKLFITHGGLLSTLEALHNGVPLLVIPVFGDQPSNADRAVLLGYGRKVHFDNYMGMDLKVALNDMLNDDSYSKKAKYLSKLFNKREVKPSKLISHNIEIAIESRGAYHLRPPSRVYAWYERWMLDVVALLLVILYVLCQLVKKLFAMWRGQSTSKGKKEKRY